MNGSVRVIKIGGSLLSFERLRPAMAQWLDRQKPATDVIVVGGGKLAEVIREMDALHQIGDQTGHWLCVTLMSVSAQLLSQIVPRVRLIDSYETLVHSIEADEPQRIVFVTERFLREHEQTLPGPKCSHDWLTTSDTIAARLAIAISADELVLAKSLSVPPDTTRQHAAQEGFVDARFPLVAGAMRVRWVNLRDPNHTETVLR